MFCVFVFDVCCLGFYSTLVVYSLMMFVLFLFLSVPMPLLQLLPLVITLLILFLLDIFQAMRYYLYSWVLLWHYSCFCCCHCLDCCHYCSGLCITATFAALLQLVVVAKILAVASLNINPFPLTFLIPLPIFVHRAGDIQTLLSCLVTAVWVLLVCTSIVVLI